MADGGGCVEVVVAEKTDTGEDTLFGLVVGEFTVDGECSCDERRIFDDEEFLRSLITLCLTGGMIVFIDDGTPNVDVGCDGPAGAE